MIKQPPSAMSLISLMDKRHLRTYNVRVMNTLYEFFCGGGMARAGLGQDWSCVLANDNDKKKSDIYIKNWGDSELVTADVGDLTEDMFKEHANLVWASFPCQDLSLAGVRSGLAGKKSSAYWSFWKHIKNLRENHDEPDIVALENVVGLLHSHDGEDFNAVVNSLVELGYTCGSFVIDAARFIPQSRPRTFIIAVREGVKLPAALTRATPQLDIVPERLLKNYEKLSSESKENWVWYNLDVPLKRSSHLRDILEVQPSIKWHDDKVNARLLELMSAPHRAIVDRAMKNGEELVGTIYKRTRKVDGKSQQRAEIRVDGTAGCLRTPTGGSSKQHLFVVKDGVFKARWFTSREIARLMGLPEDYKMPVNYNEAYYLVGDGLAVPVVSFIEKNLFRNILNEEPQRSEQPDEITAKQTTPRVYAPFSV